MQYCGIKDSLVYHSLAKEYAPEYGNDLLLKEIKDKPELHGCWVLQPHFTGEMAKPETIIAFMMDNGIKSARMFPGPNGQEFSLSHWSCGEIFETLNHHKIPLLIDKALIEWGQVFEICGTYRQLPLILCEVWYKDNRYLYPLLEKFDNLYVDLCRLIGHQCLEDICKRFGERHLIFGSKLPVFTPGPAISMVLYAELEQKQKEEIAGGNLRRLLSEVL
jgi:predicted TIM-barrel fold metal-dependent hydrolase